MNKCIIW